MPGLIQGLEIARRALLAHQSAMNITGHNIANVATEGYTRRQAILTPTPPEDTPYGIIGTGVRLDGVRRNRDVFLDVQLRKESSLAGRWESRSEILQQVESVVAEPSDQGLGAFLDEFFNAWLELSNQPEDSSARAVVLQSAATLTQAFHDQDARFEQLLESTDLEVEQRVIDINTKLSDVARLNLQIQQSEISGSLDADLRDLRDVLLDDLAKEAGASYLVRSDGSVVVRLGSRTVVEGTEVDPLATERYTENGRLRIRILHSADRSTPDGLSGRLGGSLEVREEILPDVRAKYDQLAAELARAVNQIHRAGPSGRDFFVGDSASTIEIASEVESDPTQVNAGSSGDPGDNDIALAIADLRNAKVLQRSTASIGDAYRQVVSYVGTLTRQAGTVAGSQRASYEALVNQRASANGVNLDEELTGLVETQKAYEAAARIFTSTSEMIDVLLQM